MRSRESGRRSPRSRPTFATDGRCGPDTAASQTGGPGIPPRLDTDAGVTVVLHTRTRCPRHFPPVSPWRKWVAQSWMDVAEAIGRLDGVNWTELHIERPLKAHRSRPCSSEGERALALSSSFRRRTAPTGHRGPALWRTGAAPLSRRNSWTGRRHGRRDAGCPGTLQSPLRLHSRIAAAAMPD